MLLAKAAYRLQIIAGSRRTDSTLEHPLNTGVHFFFLDEFAPRDLVEAHLNLLFEPLIVRRQTGNRLLHQLVGVSSSLDSKLVELCFLISRQMHFHDDIPGIP